MQIYDISVAVSNATPVYEGDPPVQIERVEDMDKGAALNLSRIDMGAHTATHVDAPLHFVRGGTPVNQLDLKSMIGLARVVDLTQLDRPIRASDLEALGLPSTVERLLCKTRNSALWARPGFQKDFVAWDWDAAQWLVAHSLKLVGIDYLSAETFGVEPARTHLTLLGAGVVILEGLDLGQVPPGDYTLLCLPLKLAGAEGAPCRAVLVAGRIG